MEANRNDPYLRMWGQICRSVEQGLGYKAEDSWFLIPASGIGDQMLMLSLLPAFRRQHPGRITICADPRMESLLQLYRGHFDGHALVEGINVWAMRPHTRFAQGHPYCPWNSVHGDGRLYDFCLDHNISLADLTRHLLHLPPDAEMVAPTVPEPVRQSAEQRFREMGLPAGRTVILAPIANSIPAAPSKEWWRAAVGLLAERGLAVAVNLRNGARGYDSITTAHDTLIPGTVPFDCPIAEILPMADLAGYHLSLRSGVSEVLCFSSARGKIAYPVGPSADSGGKLDWRISHLGAGGTVAIPRLYGRTACEEINLLPETTPEEILRGWI